MLGERKAEQFELFAGSLRDLIPDEHVLTRVARVLDLAWLRDEVACPYCSGNGRPGIEPETAVWLMLASFLLSLVHDRRLMREATVNVAIRWFCGFGLTGRLPEHSSLTSIRQRRGEARFRRIFERTVAACVGAGIAKGEVVHIDASLVRADVSWEALATRGSIRWIRRMLPSMSRSATPSRRANTRGSAPQTPTRRCRRPIAISGWSPPTSNIPRTATSPA